MNDKEYKDFSKKRLSNNLEKKFNTTIIGSLAKFEDSFGFLWGHGLAYSELTDQQKEFRNIWKKTRVSILDSGHSNLRASQSELNQYDVHWNKYVTNLINLNVNVQDNRG
jgi:hypothetical protein